MAFYTQQSKVLSKISWASLISGLPLIIWGHDSLFSLYRVRGSSMEPTLKDGDIVFVRKSDGIWQQQTRQKEATEKKIERQTLEDFEQAHCSASPYYWLLKNPPLPLTGDIVIYKDKESYNSSKWNIKRVVGLGGQVVMVPSSRFDSSILPPSIIHVDDESRSTSMRVATMSVPPYSLWVEGDNLANSYDSRNKAHGPVSKKLLVGIAEYILWPPTRVKPLLQQFKSPESRPQAYWT